MGYFTAFFEFARVECPRFVMLSHATLGLQNALDSRSQLKGFVKHF